MGRFQTCSKCRALLERGTRVCPYCDANQAAALAPSEDADAEATGRFASWMLIAVVLVYVATVAVDPAKDERTSQFAPSSASLGIWGAADRGRIRDGEYWRLISSMFLHADLRHLLFNAIALFVLTPIVARTLGADRTTCVYVIGGALAGIVSHVAGTPSAVGASGAVCALIAAAAVYGRRRGGGEGDLLFRRMATWAVIIVLIGAWMPRVDNWGHLGGFGAGAALGWFAAAVRIRGGRADRSWRVAAIASLVLVVAAFAIGVIPNVVEVKGRDAAAAREAREGTWLTSTTSIPRSACASAPTAPPSRWRRARRSTRSGTAWSISASSRRWARSPRRTPPGSPSSPPR